MLLCLGFITQSKWCYSCTVDEDLDRSCLL